ncbi:MAG: DUF1801 domain-containing protein [Sphingobacteriales bacterium]|nr:MAG: DUF1801 domain-containing protein [Sphingobacteriales bacterium]
MSQNELDSLLSAYPAHVQELVELLRTFIKARIKGIEETPDLPAKIIGYGFSNEYIDSICTIILSQKGIKLGFYKGTLLPDPAGLLEGTGKVHKYVAIKSATDIENPALEKLLLDAYDAYLERKRT